MPLVKSDLGVFMHLCDGSYFQSHGDRSSFGVPSRSSPAKQTPTESKSYLDKAATGIGGRLLSFCAVWCHLRSYRPSKSGNKRASSHYSPRSRCYRGPSIQHYSYTIEGRLWNTTASERQRLLETWVAVTAAARSVPLPIAIKATTDLTRYACKRG